MTPKIYYVVIFDSYFKMNMDDWKEAQKTETFTKFRGQWGIWLLVMQIGGGQTATCRIFLRCETFSSFLLAGKGQLNKLKENLKILKVQ
jgi:hypothetical protein